MSRRRPSRGRRWLLLGALLVGVLLGAVLAQRGLESVPIPSVTAGDDAERPVSPADGRPAPSGAADLREQTPAPAGPPTSGDAEPSAPQPVGRPQRIQIPAIAVDAEIVPAGLREDGAMEVPDFGLAGWYTEGPRPGEEGPATVVAHVDSRSGPDVFARLRELEAGDEVRIQGEDGTVRFVVEASERAPKDRLPEDRIWGWTTEPTLRLITCDGWFDQSTGHYDKNLIVYLALASG